MSTVMTATLCELKRINKYFPLPTGGEQQVLRDIDLSIYEEEVVALLGPSGCGKSTLLRILTGLIPPTSGQVLVHGEPLRGINPAVAMVFQNFALYPWMTVAENVEEGIRAELGHTPRQTAGGGSDPQGRPFGIRGSLSA